MAFPTAKSFKPVAQKARSIVSGIGKAIRDVSDNVTQPGIGAQADKDRAAIKLARSAKGMSMKTAVDNKMYDVANAMTDTARIKRQVAKRRKATK